MFRPLRPKFSTVVFCVSCVVCARWLRLDVSMLAAMLASSFGLQQLRKLGYFWARGERSTRWARK